MKLVQRKTALQSLRKVNYSAWLMLLPGLFLLYFMVWRPVVVGAGLSLFELKGYEPVKFIGLANYKRVLTDTLFIKTLFNTVQYVVWSLVIGFLPPIIVAIMLNEMVHGKAFFKFAIYFPVIVPTVAVSLIWYFLYQPDPNGLLNMFTAKFGIPTSTWLQNPNLTIPLIVVSMTWKGFGGTMIMYLASLQGVNQELYEAAKIDGAGGFRRVFNITLPQIFPVVMLFLIKQIIGVFQIMVEPMTMTAGGPNNASVSLALQGYNYAFTYFQPANALALGFITFVLLMGLTIVYFKVDKKLSAN
ncbi:MAG: sugar ABC transporter permease [Oscillospiraceae bacterium]